MLARFCKNLFLILIVVFSLYGNISFGAYYPPLKVQKAGDPIDLSNLKFSALEEFNAGMKQSNGDWQQNNNDYKFIRQQPANFVATLAGVLGMVLSGLLRPEKLLIFGALISLAIGRKFEKLLLFSLFTGISAASIYINPLIIFVTVANILLLLLIYLSRKMLLKRGFSEFRWVSIILLICVFAFYYTGGDLSSSIPWMLAFELLNTSILFMIMLKIIKIIGINKSINEGVKSVRDAVLEKIILAFNLGCLIVYISVCLFKFIIQAVIFITYPLLKVGFRLLSKVYQWFLQNQPTYK